MKCLSLKQPWADMVVTHDPDKRGACLKDIENRKWRMGRKLSALMPFDCLIQASLTVDLDGFPQLREQARLARIEIPDAKLMTVGAIVGQVTIFNQTQHSESPWFVGPWGFELMNPVKFPNPFPFKGQLGFFDIEDEIADQIFYEGVRMSESDSTYVEMRLSGKPLDGPLY